MIIIPRGPLPPQERRKGLILGGLMVIVFAVVMMGFFGRGWTIIALWLGMGVLGVLFILWGLAQR